MRIDRSEWRRKHDDRRAPPLIASPRAHFFPENRQDLIDIVRQSLGEAQVAVRASGSHCALSHAAVTDSFAVETRGLADPDGFPESPVLNRTLNEVIPGCLTEAKLNELIAQPALPIDADPPDAQTFNYYHVEAGTSIFELYSRLDAGDDMPTRSHPLTREVAALQGPWAMPTLGGAGGQTIVGAFSTGTHGGDQHLTPIADAVQAIHLIACDGREYWIERGTHEQTPLALVDDKRLLAVYGGIEIIRDNDVFDGVLVSVGRIGIIYAVVLKVVRQFALRQTRSTESWTAIATRLRDPADPLFRSRFLQVVINPHPKPENPGDHTCYVETRELASLAGMATFRGRAERTGANAGRNAPIGTDDVRLLICSLDDVRPLVAALILTAADRWQHASARLAAGDVREEDRRSGCAAHQSGGGRGLPRRDADGRHLGPVRPGGGLRRGTSDARRRRADPDRVTQGKYLEVKRDSQPRRASERQQHQNQYGHHRESADPPRPGSSTASTRTEFLVATMSTISPITSISFTGTTSRKPRGLVVPRCGRPTPLRSIWSTIRG